PPPPPPAISTLSLPDALPILAYPTAPAFYPVPVRPLRSLPPASSPPRLTATQLPLASDSGRHGSQRTSTSNISAMPGAPHQIGSLLVRDLARSALEEALQLLQRLQRPLGHEHVAAVVQHLDAAIAQQAAEFPAGLRRRHLVLGPDQQQDRAGDLRRKGLALLPGIAGGQIRMENARGRALQQAPALSGQPATGQRLAAQVGPGPMTPAGDHLDRGRVVRFRGGEQVGVHWHGAGTAEKRQALNPLRVARRRRQRRDRPHGVPDEACTLYTGGFQDRDAPVGDLLDAPQGRPLGKAVAGEIERQDGALVMGQIAALH